MLVQSFLEDSARRLPDKTALISGGARHTYAAINAMADRTAATLLAAGLEKGGRAVVFLDNSLEAVVSVFAVLKAGGVFLMVNPTMKAEKLSYILNNSRATVLIGHSAGAGIIKEAVKNAPSLKSVFLAGRTAAPADLGIPTSRHKRPARPSHGPSRRYVPSFQTAQGHYSPAKQT